MVIGSVKAATAYSKLIGELGLEISRDSLLSEDGSTFEFIKRLVSNGKEISPIPWGLLGWDRAIDPIEFLYRWAAAGGRVDSYQKRRPEYLNEFL